MEKQKLKISIPTNKDLKDWENSVISCTNFTNKDSHPVFRESIYFFPYLFVLDEEGYNIAFINREHEFLPQRISINTKTDVKWYKVEITDVFKKAFAESTLKMNINGISYNSYNLYDGKTSPYSSESNLIDYIRKINYIDLHLINHSPFINRLLLTVLQSYNLLYENINLRKENKRLEELNNSLKDNVKRGRKEIEHLRKINNK